MATLLWVPGNARSGSTMSFLDAREPTSCDLVTDVLHRLPRAGVSVPRPDARHRVHDAEGGV